MSGVGVEDLLPGDFRSNVAESRRKLVAEAAQPAALTETRLVTSYEAYYLDRHQQRPLPALFARLNDASGSMFYIDPKTARLVEAYGGRSRLNRWLYHGLHSWDLPWLYRYRPAWDIFVLLLLLGGTCLCVTSVIIAFQFVRRKLSLEQEQP